MQFDRDWATALKFDWTLGDGRHARVRLAHFTTCEIPELAPLVNARVASVEFTDGEIFGDLRVHFDSGHTLQVLGIVLDRATVSRKSPG